MSKHLRMIYCKVGLHTVKSCYIFDLKVKQPICLCCREKMIAIRAAQVLTPRIADRDNPALPGRNFRMLLV